MPYPRYNGGNNSNGGNYGASRGYSSSNNTNVNPWQMGGQPVSNNKVDPLALMGSLMGAMIGGAGNTGQGNGNPLLAGLAMANAMNSGGMSMNDSRRPYDDRDRRDRQRGRDRSPARRSYRSRSRDRRQDRRRSSAGSSRRQQRSPEKRAEHEIYIGNYPVKFKESDVRKLFEEHDVKVGAIRLKHDGLKVFAFAETDSVDQIEKAKSAMEGVEIQGRKLRVRSSKDTDKKRNEERDKEKREERDRKRKARDALKKDDVKKHLVNAFVGFLGRELESESVSIDDGLKDLLDTAKTALMTAYTLPDDESLAVPRKIEDIFFKDVRDDVKIELPEEAPKIKEEKEDIPEENEDNDNVDDDSSWKRRGYEKNDDELEENCENAAVTADHETEKDDEQENEVDGAEEEFNSMVESELANIHNDDELLVNV